MEVVMKCNMINGERPGKHIERGIVFLLLLLLSHLVLSNPLTAQENRNKSEASDKSPAEASLFALSGTLIPGIAAFTMDPPANIILLSGGLVFGPVVGYAYMENTKLGLRYAGFRAIVLGGTIGSVYLICSLGDCNLGIFGDEEGSEFGLAVTITLIGTIATVFLNLHDTLSIGHRVESRGTRIAIAPVYFPQEKTPGIRAACRF